MARKRFSPKQIVAKLREAERLQGQGMTVAQVCRRIGVSDQTFARRSGYQPTSNRRRHRGRQSDLFLPEHFDNALRVMGVNRKNVRCPPSGRLRSCGRF